LLPPPLLPLLLLLPLLPLLLLLLLLWVCPPFVSGLLVLTSRQS
jgi:hypothetical protein